MWVCCLVAVPLSQARPLSPERGPVPEGYPALPFASPTGQQVASALSPRRYDMGYQESPERRSSSVEPATYLSSPERRLDHQRSLPATFNSAYGEPFYGDQANFGSRSGSATPIIDEEARSVPSGPGVETNHFLC